MISSDANKYVVDVWLLDFLKGLKFIKESLNASTASRSLVDFAPLTRLLARSLVRSRVLGNV